MRKRAPHTELSAQALVTVILLLSIVFSLGVGLLFHARSFRDLAGLQADNDRAYSLARSGIDIGLSFVNQTPCGCVKDETYNFGSDRLRVEVNVTAQNYGGEFVVMGNIASTGTSDRSQRILKKSVVGLPFGEYVKGIGDNFVFGTGTEEIYSVQQTSDGGYILGGRNDHIGLVIKTKSDSTVEWAKNFNDIFGDPPFGKPQVRETSDGGYIVAGTILPGSGSFSYDFVAIKLKADLTVDWKKRYGQFPSNLHDYLYDIEQTSDGGYIMVGTSLNLLNSDSLYDGLAIKINNLGNIVWARGFSADSWNGPGTSGNDFFIEVEKTPLNVNGGYILGGKTQIKSRDDFLVIKIDSNGAISQNAGNNLWGLYGNFINTNSQEELVSLKSTQNAGYIIGGKTDGFGAGINILFLKLNNDLNKTWSKVYDYGAGEEIWSVLSLSGGYLIGGNKNVVGGQRHAFLFRTDLNGDFVWAKSYGGASMDSLFSLNLSGNGGYVFAGTTSSFASGGPYDALLLRTDSQGDITCCPIYQIENPPNLVSAVVETHKPITEGNPNYFDASIEMESITVNITDYTRPNTIICPQSN